MPAADWQRVRLNAGLDLLRASRLKDLQDAKLAAFHDQVAALQSEVQHWRERQNTKGAALRSVKRLAELSRKARFEIPCVQARREDAIKQIEAAAAALGRFVTEEITETLATKG